MREPLDDVRDGEGGKHEEDVKVHEAEPVPEGFYTVSPEEWVSVRWGPIGGG